MDLKHGIYNYIRTVSSLRVASAGLNRFMGCLGRATFTVHLIFDRTSAQRCVLPIQWIYYYDSNKSTGKEAGKTHLCAAELNAKE